MHQRNSGFSLLEVLTVVGLIMIVSSVAVVQMRQSMTILDADRAANLVMGQMRYARQVAVDQRRDVLLEFTGTNEITVTRLDPGSVETLLSEVTLPSGYAFGLPSGVGDTPDGYGNSGAVVFGSAGSGTFLGDGILVNSSGIVVNGSVFTIGSGNGSARAITLNGASGRVKQYAITGTTWVER